MDGSEVPAGATVSPSGGEAHEPYSVVEVNSVLYELTDPSPRIHLLEAEPPYRYLEIPVALADAIALAHAVARVEGARPTTHELTSAILGRLRADVVALRIARREAGVFYGELDVMTATGREVFDCRVSDGIVLALRQAVPAPILCAESILATIEVDPT